MSKESYEIYNQLKQKVINKTELNLEDQLNLTRLQAMAPMVNLLYSSSTGTGIADFVTGTVFSEAMDLYMNNTRVFLTDVLQPLQAISANDLMGNIIGSHHVE